jgi:hypothetical protein
MSRPLEQQSYMNQLIIAANQQRAKDANFTFNFLSKDNY